MTQTRVTKRPKGAPGVKVLLTTASVTATIGGWAAFTTTEPPPPPPPAPTPSATVAAIAPPLELPVLPTLVPLVAPVARAGGDHPAPVVIPTTPAASPTPHLRQVQAPPPVAAAPAPARPITRTRSSR